jgi:hypothetical protein
MTTKELETALEQMIDAKGIPAVLHALAMVCHEKSDHVDTTWQDRSLARLWTKSAQRFERLIPNEWPL